MDELPGNPYYFDGSTEYWKNQEKIIKSYKDGFNTAKKFYIKKRESIGECPICYDKMDEGYINTNCNHTMCFHCFSKIIENTNNHNCPLCRSVLLVGVKNNTEINKIINNTYDGGYDDGYDEGFLSAKKIGELNEKKLKDKFNSLLNERATLVNEYLLLKKLYKGTVIQLQNTHSLNINMNKNIIRRNSIS